MTQTKITQNDLKMFPSERLTDNDDGGGFMLGTPLTGKPNELFDPIPRIARINGAFYARLVYMGLLRADDEPLLGGYAAITAMPKDPTVSYLMFRATKYGEQRKEILKRIEAYSVATIESRMTLMSTQSLGSKVVQGYQAPNEPLPLIGDVYCLRQDKSGYPQVEQYVQVTRVKSEDREFINPVTNKKFIKTVLQLEISHPLKADFIGVDYPKEDYADNPCKIRETHVADSAKYYGIKPLAAAASKESMTVKVPTIMEKLVPTNQVETPLMDLTAAGQRPLFFDGAMTGNDGVVSINVGRTLTSETVFHLGNAALPNSVTIYTSEGEAKNIGKTLKIADKAIGTIDHARGEVRLTESGTINRITYRPAATELKVADTAAIDVTQNNRSYNYLMTIDPVPPAGCLIVSYRSQGRWYDLHDHGDGKLRGISVGHGSGSLNLISGTVAITCGEMPDVGSQILYAWGTKSGYKNRSGSTVAAEMVFHLAQEPVPGSVNLTWNDNGAKASADDGAGNLTGHWTGKIDYAGKTITVPVTSGFAHPAAALDVTATYQSGTPQLRSFSSPARNADGTITLDLGATNIPPGLLRMRFNLAVENYDDTPTTANTFRKNWVVQYQDAKDNGAGKLVTPAGVELGTFNNATGKLTFNPSVSVTLPKPRYKKVAMGERPRRYSPIAAPPGSIIIPGSRQTETLYRNVFSHYDNVPAAASLPTDNTALVEVTFYAASTGTAVTETLASGTVSLDLLPHYAERIVPNSVVFVFGGKTYFDRRGELYTDLNIDNGSATKAGQINYNAGKGIVSLWNSGFVNQAPVIKSLATTINGNPVDEVTFRAPSSPLRPASLQISATKLSGGQITVRAGAGGAIASTDTEGMVDVEAGVARLRFGREVDATGKENEPWYNANAVKDGKIWQPEPVFAETITYNAVAYSYLPADSTVVKIDTVRLPGDGRVPIFRRGDTILIANRQSQDLGTSHSGGATVQLSRNNLDRICIKDAKGNPVLATLWDYDLDAGTITWASPLDLSAYTQPLTAHHVQEERNRITIADIDGTLTLQFPLKRAYPTENTTVSSVLIAGKLQVRATVPFTQRNWNGSWSDEPNGAQLLNRLNVKDFPFVLTDDGAITERWLIKFGSGNTFELFGETLGLVAKTDTTTDLAPINPATNKPYFTLPSNAFGAVSAWASQDVIRFNTFGAQIPIWELCAVQPSSTNSQGEDGYDHCLFGDTTAV